MSRVIYNRQIDKTYFLIKTDTVVDTKPGQFFMLRAWDKYPTLSRPISIFNVEDDGLVFLYEVRGEGTKIISQLKEGDEIKVFGPYGNGFEYRGIDEISLVGGGVGNAPFYYLSKCIKIENPNAKIDFYLGERVEQNIESAFEDLDVNLIVKKGGFITECMEYDKKLIYTCGPSVMMEKVSLLGAENGCQVYVSLENRMGCGVGACLSCTCKTKTGNKRACKEGPVFKGADLIG